MFFNENNGIHSIQRDEVSEILGELVRAILNETIMYN